MTVFASPVLVSVLFSHRTWMLLLRIMFYCILFILTPMLCYVFLVDFFLTKCLESGKVVLFAVDGIVLYNFIHQLVP